MSDADAYRKFLLQGGVADLSDRVKLMLKGADRVRYLNGQVTSNVTKLRQGETQPACVTTAKGRLCAEIMITAGADALLIDADATLAEALPGRLERYIVADDVELVELPSDTRLLHFLGSDSFDFSRLIVDTPPQRARRFGKEGWDLWTTAERLEDFSLDGILTGSLLETIRIEHGIARWGFELDEETLPPEAGLERTHIDYHKGCYIGQEVISRLKSIGHVNRQLTGFISNGAPLTPGMRVFGKTPVAEGSEPKPIGTITSAAWSFALEKPVALGYLRRGAAIEGLIAQAPGTPAVSITAQALPFVP